MRDVFISYRRSDSAGHAGRLLDALGKRFDADKFFRDIEDLEPGVDFPEALNRALAQCTAMLVVIGPTWASAPSPKGGTRINEADDFVRLEVAAGLARKEVRVIPVLVGGAALPTAKDLPPDLQGLTRRNAFELSDGRWKFDVDKLADSLDTSVRRGPLSGKRVAAVGAVVLASAAAFGAYKFIDFKDGPDPAKEAEVASRIAKANAEKALADFQRADAEAKLEALNASKKKADAEQANATAAAAKAAADKAEADRQLAANASAEEKAKADAEAARLAKENEAAQQLAAAKAAEAEAARQRDEKAQAEAVASKVRQDETAATAARTADVAQVAAQSQPQKTERDGAAQPLSFPRWTLSSGGCGAGPLTVSGTARFSIRKTAEGVVVSEEFRGQGSGFEVQVTGSATFPKEQKSYDIPTTGQWSGSRVFKSAGVDRVNTSDGLTPRTANVMKIQSLCS